MVDRIVAVVNQEIITLSEVEKMGRSSPQEEISDRGSFGEARNKLMKFRRKVLEKLIEEKLIDQEVKKSGIKVTSKEIEAALEEIKRRNAATQEDLEKALAKEGLTLEAFKKQIEKRILRHEVDQVGCEGGIKVGEKELRDFYQKNIDRYRSNESYRPSHILFVVPKGGNAGGGSGNQEEVSEGIRKDQKRRRFWGDGPSLFRGYL